MILMTEESITTQGKVDTSVQNGIGHITFHHPKSNSLPGKLLSELAQAIQDMGQNEDARVIVLQSEGEKAFCAGASFDELLSIEDYPTGKEFFMGFARVINAARKCPKFIIGRVQGKAVGGGVGMAAATDYCLATEAASIKLSELAIGIGPFVVGPAVERKVGRSAFIALSIDTDWKTADWAREKGLYMDTFSTLPELDSAVENLTEKLANYSPEAMQELKWVFWQGTENWDELLENRAEQSGRLVLSDFTTQAIDQFKAGVR